MKKVKVFILTLLIFIITMNSFPVHAKAFNTKNLHSTWLPLTIDNAIYENTQ